MIKKLTSIIIVCFLVFLPFTTLAYTWSGVSTESYTQDDAIGYCVGLGFTIPTATQYDPDLSTFGLPVYTELWTGTLSNAPVDGYTAYYSGIEVQNSSKVISLLYQVNCITGESPITSPRDENAESVYLFVTKFLVEIIVTIVFTSLLLGVAFKNIQK